MSGAGGRGEGQPAGGSRGRELGRAEGSSFGRRRYTPGVPIAVPSLAAHAHSYPGPEDDAGLLRKLLKRRSSGLLERQAQPPVSSAQLRRNRDKHIALLEEGQLLQSLGSRGADGHLPSPPNPPGLGVPGDDELLPPAVEEQSPVTAAAATGRIAIHCTAASYDLKGLKEHLESGGFLCTEYPEVLCSRYMKRSGEIVGEMFFYDFGVAVFWDLIGAQEQKVLRETLSRFEEGKLSSAKVESETFAFRLVPYAKPSIQNDLVTLSPNMPDLHLMKLSISFALAQSTKLSVLEERALSIAAATRKLPNALAEHGKVHISDKAVARLMGRVFIEQAALNLLGSVLDTPDFFWSPGISDNMQSVYDKVFEYLEMQDRIAVLNARLAVLHELLDMLRLQGQAQHSDFLEVIIIVLICVDVVILLATVAATLGLIGGGGGGLGPDHIRASLGQVMAYAVSWAQA